jgi:hypothetical protein
MPEQGPCHFPGRTHLNLVFDPIIVKAGGYEASTDGLALTIRRDNGVVVGEGQVALGASGFWIGGYEGKLDDEVRKAVEALIAEHYDDIVARRIVLSGGAAVA